MKEKASKLTVREEQILDDLEETIKWVKLHEAGKVKAKPIEAFLNELPDTNKSNSEKE